MFVQRPDARLFTLRFGHGPRTLLAIGGWVAGGEVWHPLFGHLPDWRCISMDHRGSGASSHQGPIRLSAMADDVLAVADAQQAGRCILAAESSGAGPAIEAVLRAPHRFAGLVLVGASWQRPAEAAQSGFIGALQRDHAATLRAFVAQCLPEPDSDDWKRWGLQVLQRASLEAAVQLVRCRSELDLESRVAQLRLPVLLVHGSADAIVPPQASETLARLLPDAVLHLLPRLGHVPIVTAPAHVAALIEQRFANRPEPAAASTS